MNLSRAYTLDFNEELSVGRVQTPTLAMLVERELAIRAFVPEDYLEVVATFSPDGSRELEAAARPSYKGTWFRGTPPAQRRRGSRPHPMQNRERTAKRPCGSSARARTGRAEIESIRAETKRMPPPLLYDLTELQRHANRLYGFSAKKTLGLAQTLYEQKKLISYPRTDSRHLSTDVATTLPEIVRAIQGPYHDRLAPGTGERPLGEALRGRRQGHRPPRHHPHAHLSRRRQPRRGREQNLRPHLPAPPLGLARRSRLVGDDRDHRHQRSPAVRDRGTHCGSLSQHGHSVDQVGWKVLDIEKKKKTRDERDSRDEKKDDEPAPVEENQDLPPGLAQGQAQEVLDVRAVAKQTRPPKRFTEATLLTAMETAGKTLDDKELSAP